MKVRFFNYYSGKFRDKNQLELVYATGTGSYVDIVGSISLPTGTIIIDSDATSNALMLQGRWIALFDNSKEQGTDLNFIVKVNRITALDGVHLALDYEIDWLRTWYNYKLDIHGRTPLGRVSPFEQPGMRITALSSNTYWDKFKNVELPTTGKIITSMTEGNIVKTAEEVGLLNQKNLFLVVVKAPYYDTSVTPAILDFYNDVSYVLVTPETLTDMIWYWISGDQPYKGTIPTDQQDYYWGAYRLPSVVLSAIDGIYYLPGLTLKSDGTIPGLVGATINQENFFIKHIGSDGNDEALDIVTGSNVGYSGTGIYRLKLSGDSVYVKFDTGLSVKVTDFRDLYYKKYKMYIPYVGSVDVPLTALTDYPTNTTETIKLDIDYVFNLDDGSVSAQWDDTNGNLKGNLITGWTPLPKVPILFNSTGTSMYQIDAYKDLSLSNTIASSVTSVVGNVASGNILGLVGDLVNSGIQIGNTFSKAEIAKNVAAATAFSSTSVSGSSGRFYRKFWLTTTETEIAFTNDSGFSDYMEDNGYPVSFNLYNSFAGLSSFYRIWLDPSAWTENIYTYFIPVSDQIKNQIQEMGYVYITNLTP